MSDLYPVIGVVIGCIAIGVALYLWQRPKSPGPHLRSDAHDSAADHARNMAQAQILGGVTQYDPPGAYLAHGGSDHGDSGHGHDGDSGWGGDGGDGGGGDGGGS